MVRLLDAYNFEGVTLPKFNSSPLKNDGWKKNSPVGMVYLQGRTVKLSGGSL